jgi:serine/threonine protein kinase
VTESIQKLQAALGDRYEVERELGSGGMATVYLARDLKHNRSVAVKVMRAETTAAMGSERFLREIQITAGTATSSSSRTAWQLPSPWIRAVSTWLRSGGKL